MTDCERELLCLYTFFSRSQSVIIFSFPIRLRQVKITRRSLMAKCCSPLCSLALFCLSDHSQIWTSGGRRLARTTVTQMVIVNQDGVIRGFRFGYAPPPQAQMRLCRSSCNIFSVSHEERLSLSLSLPLSFSSFTCFLSFSSKKKRNSLLPEKSHLFHPSNGK